MNGEKKININLSINGSEAPQSLKDRIVELIYIKKERESIETMIQALKDNKLWRTAGMAVYGQKRSFVELFRGSKDERWLKCSIEFNDIQCDLMRKYFEEVLQNVDKLLDDYTDEEKDLVNAFNHMNIDCNTEIVAKKLGW